MFTIINSNVYTKEKIKRLDQSYIARHFALMMRLKFLENIITLCVVQEIQDFISNGNIYYIVILYTEILF